ncbi:GILT-like protein 1 [Pseudolycoriella hygida]|uniref:GILT-like protein 1 n=1 Tax=Pseudolycoriella hygida TaxID=35572 RepID=A0A9Q0N0I7_9DIPT|nr:GILT-like protein 1 [Pseudolycoriella hygida]
MFPYARILLFMGIALGVTNSQDSDEFTSTTDFSRTEATPSKNISASNKLQIDIYYETLCPYSNKFFNEQFAPAYDTFKNYIVVRFVPSGSAEIINNGESFQCQHGPRECEGNAFHSCVLNYLHNDQDAQVKFITEKRCQINKRVRNVPLHNNRCLLAINLLGLHVSDCMSGPKRRELQLSAGKETLSIEGLRFVPTVVYNKEFDLEKAEDSTDDFRRIVCEELGSLQIESDELTKMCPEIQTTDTVTSTLTSV